MYPQLGLAWKGPVVVDLSGLASSGVNPLHRDHDSSRPVGHSTTVDNDGTRLVCSGVFSIPGDDATEIVTGSRNGFPWRPSVGVKVVAYTTLSAGQSARINGRNFEGPLLWVQRSILKEISLVTVPGDDSATIEISAQFAAQLSAQSPMTFEQYLASLGIDPATLTPEAKSALELAFNQSQSTASASSGTPAPAPSGAPPVGQDVGASGAVDLTAQQAHVDLAAYRRIQADETLRCNGIRDLCATHAKPRVVIGGTEVDLEAHAIATGMSVEQCELAALRHANLEATRDARPRGPAIHSRSSADVNMESLQASLLLRAGMQLDSPAFERPAIRHKLAPWLQASVNDPVRQRAMENAHRMSDISLVDACRFSLHARGIDAPINRIDMINASFSSGSASALFGATLGATVLASYSEVKDFSAGLFEESENPDLEQHNRNRVQSAQSLKHHPPGGDTPHTGRTVATEKSQVNRFTRQMKLDEADMLSDNFGKFKDTPRDFGLAAGRVRPDLVAATIMSNPTLLATGRALFNTTDGNMTASGKALARATLSEMIALIRKRTDGDAVINLEMNRLIVPSELLDTAIQLCYSVVISNDSGSGEVNPIQQYGIDPVSDARFSNGMVHPVTGASIAGSATTYYGFSTDAHLLDITYLAGASKTPVVRSEPLTGGEFGMVFDVRHYVGVIPLDWRGWHRFAA